MNTALLIIDLQNDYFEGGAMPLVGSEKASLNAAKVLKFFRENHWPVVHIQHVSTRPGSTFFLPETEGIRIHSNVEPLQHEKVITKHFPNSFRETLLLDYLRSKDVTKLVVCGMMTHMCVDATTRAAKDLGFDIELIGDACATRDLEVGGQKVKAKDVHNAFLAALNYFYASVRYTDQWLEEFQRK
jgi:nicotinamidase-related amidase